MAKSRIYTANIKGIEWKVYAQSTAAYNRAHGTDSHAITYYKDRLIYFKLSELASSYVRHEIMHAYVASCNTNSSNLVPDQVEELCAEIYGDHGPEMDLLVDRIINY
jgi:hypothetical protein